MQRLAAHFEKGWYQRTSRHRRLTLTSRLRSEYIRRVAVVVYYCATMSDYLYCGVVQVRGVHDEHGLLCGGDSVSLCSDCGTSLCSVHCERCEICREIFCPSCLSFHRADHPKPAQAEPLHDRKKTA